jgi:hypothetical protein
MPTKVDQTCDASDSPHSIPAEYFNFLMRRLVSMPLKTLEDAKLWDDACAAIRAEMNSKFPTFEISDRLQTLLSTTSPAWDVITRQQKQTAINDCIIRRDHGNKRTTIELKPAVVRVVVTTIIPISSFFFAMPISQAIGTSESDWFGLGIIFRAGLIFLFGCALAAGYWTLTKADSG